MFAKLCGGSDTPLVTMKCVFINRSPDVVIDHTDGGSCEGEKEFETKSCCCFQWRRRRRPQNENKLATTLSNVSVEELPV
jgi:hypothetical protein